MDRMAELVHWPLNPETRGNPIGFTDISGRSFTCGEGGVIGIVVCSRFATARHSDGSSTRVPKGNILSITVSKSDMTEDSSAEDTAENGRNEVKRLIRWLKDYRRIVYLGCILAALVESIR